MKKFIAWRRVSTKKQGKSGLGLEAQKDIIKYFVKQEQGELIADYCEVYTGTNLNGCIELRNAINHAKREKAILIIAKTDRFRNTYEALQVLEEIGENNIMFCDLPHTDKFTLTLFFAMAEREALLISIRTKAGLSVRKRQIEENGEFISSKGNKCTRLGGNGNMDAAVKKSAENRRLRAKNDEKNQFFWKYICQYEERNGKLTANTKKEVFEDIADELNALGLRTHTGLEYTSLRVRALWNRAKERYVYVK